MFLLERQHNKLESAYYWLFWYNIYYFPLFVYWNTKSCNNNLERAKLSVILVKSQSWSFRYDLKKIRENPRLEVKYFRFQKISLETWGYLSLWREHPVEKWLTIAKVRANGKNLQKQGKITCLSISGLLLSHDSYPCSVPSMETYTLGGTDRTELKKHLSVAK